MPHDTPAGLQYKKLWQQGGQCMQRRFTCDVVKGPHASVARALDIGEIVVHEKRLFWRHTQPLGGKLIDACVRLQQPLLRGEDKHVCHCAKATALLQRCARLRPGVAEQRRLIARAQRLDEPGHLFINRFGGENVLRQFLNLVRV